ncbi:unnamed protein product, partial [Darwinula stevensoni]
RGGLGGGGSSLPPFGESALENSLIRGGRRRNGDIGCPCPSRLFTTRPVRLAVQIGTSTYCVQGDETLDASSSTLPRRNSETIESNTESNIVG